MDPQVLRAEDEDPHFLTLEELYSYHARVLAPGATLRLVERPIVNYDSGLAVATLRVREDAYKPHMGEMVLKSVGEPNYAKHLKTAIASLFEIYGPGFFDCTVTANALIMGNQDKRYSLFYGQSYSKANYSMGEPQVLRNPGDYAKLRTEFTVDDFADLFHTNHENSDVSVLSLCNIVFIFTRYLDNFLRDQTCGTTLTTVY